MPITYKQVVETEDEGYSGYCYGSAPKSDNEFCGFQSLGWEKKKDAVARMKEHAEEHDKKEPMQELEDFRVQQGVST